jgi:3-oxoacyl-[acyl-carrier-protein] synthase II
MGRRVVVTGMGLLTALGNDLASSWESLLAGRSGVRRITRFDPEGFATQIAAEVKDFEPERWIEKKETRRPLRRRAWLSKTAGSGFPTATATAWA